MFSPCIVIPVYGHHRSLPRVLDGLRALGAPCIVVDDGSDAACAAALEAICSSEPDRVELIRHERNRGKGAAVLSGMRRAAARGCTHVLQVDADAQHDLAAGARFLAAAQQNPAHLVLGQPVYDASVPPARLHGRRLTTLWMHINTLSEDIADGMCGFRVYPLAATLALAERTRLGPRMEFDIDVAVRLHRAGVPVLNLPVAVTYPADGLSHFRMWRDNARISLTHARHFFGMLATLPARALRRTRAQHWSGVREGGSVAGMRMMLTVFRLLGRGPFLAVLAPVVLFYYAARPVARRASREYLARVFPDAGRFELAWLGYRHFFTFGECLLDKALVWSGWLPEQVEFSGMEPLSECVHRDGRGALVLVSHLGNIELLRALAKLHRGTRLTVMVHTLHTPKFAAFLARVEPENQVDLLQVSEVNPATAVDLAERIGAGQIVVIAADRVPLHGGRTAAAAFFGTEASFPVGPHVLASLLGCPVWLMFSLRFGDRHRIVFEPFAEHLRLPRRERERLLCEAVSRYAARLEHYCRQAPLQWFNFYPFWSRSDAPAK